MWEMFQIGYVLFLTRCFDGQVSALRQTTLSNKNLIVAAEPWPPFLVKKTENGIDKYSGLMWDFMEYIKSARNCSYKLVGSPDGLWGNCYGINNCTGMIGQVNRKEVDFAIGLFHDYVSRMKQQILDSLIHTFVGPFSKTSDRVNAVDFTVQVADGYYSVVLPLKHESKMWFFIDPFSYSVWLGFLLSIPIYVLAMGLADYLFCGHVDLDDLTGFIMRNALSEQNFAPPNNTQTYKKILIITWIWSMLVLVQSYAGNLTAMLARPKIQEPLRTLEELLSQDEVSWIIPDKLAEYYLRTSESGSQLRRLYEGRTIIHDQSKDCFPTESFKEGRLGSICSMASIMALTNYDYSKTGKCNYYMTEDKFLTSGASMAFQVKIACAVEISPDLLPFISERESIP